LMSEPLWKRVNELESDGSDRTELVSVISHLIYEDLPFALEKGAADILWSSQKRLLDQVRIEYRRIASQDPKSMKRSLANDYTFHLSTAKTNCANVLRSLYAEWANIAVLVEATEDGKQLCGEGIIPHNESTVEKLAGMDADAHLKVVAELVYTRLGDITRYMHEFALSKKFYAAALKLNPASDYCIAKSISLNNIQDQVAEAKQQGGSGK